MTYPRERRAAARETWLAAFVVACSVASLLYDVTFAPRSAPDDVDRLLGLYASVAAELPPESRVGFVSLAADRNMAAAAAYAVQSALAPRLVDSDLGNVTLAITTPNAPPTVDHDPRLHAFTPVGTSAGGVRIYRRRE